MPAAPRTNKKAKQIAYKILGVPGPLKKQHYTREQLKIRKRLQFEDVTKLR